MTDSAPDVAQGPDIPEPVLTSERVNEVWDACTVTEGTTGAVTVEGVVHSATVDPGAIRNHSGEIAELLAELADEFRSDKGGGWSFLNACNDRHGRQWTGLHLDMERLFMLGLAAGKVTLLIPRDLWDALPGGMPYYAVDPWPAPSDDLPF